MSVVRIGWGTVLVLVLVASGALAQSADMTFFVTSSGLGKGADLGGLPGADRHCAELARAAGAAVTRGGHTSVRRRPTAQPP
jgi:hypothetical protein